MLIRTGVICFVKVLDENGDRRALVVEGIVVFLSVKESRACSLAVFFWIWSFMAFLGDCFYLIILRELLESCSRVALGERDEFLRDCSKEFWRGESKIEE